MGNGSSQDLHPLLTNLNETMGRVRQDMEEMRGATQKLQATVEEGFQDLHQAITDNIRAQAEMTLMEYQADVIHAEAQIDAEIEQIKNEKEELDETLDTYTERYIEKHERLSEKADQRIRDLGSHIFEIMEDLFEDRIEQPFLEHVSKVWADLRDHNRDLHQSKADEMTTELEATREEIDRFVGQQRDLVSRVDEHRTPVEPPDEATPIQIPYWVVQVERRGETEERIVIPSKLRTDGSGWFDARLDQIDEFTEVMEPLAARSVPTYPRRRGRDRFVNAIEPYAGQGLGGLLSYQEAYESVLPDSPKIMVETEEG